MNNTPNSEMDGLSPYQVHQILYNAFGEESVIGYKKEIKSEILAKIPFLKLIREFLLIVEQSGELKLTARGNLPRKLCHELYGMGIIKEDFIEKGIVKLNKEADSIVLQNIKIISSLSGITKKRNNKLSLTTKGKKLIAEPAMEALLKEIFQTNYQKFNLGYHDGYPEEAGVQRVVGYTLYLLLKYGDKLRPLKFYADKTLEAFPPMLDAFFESTWSTPQDRFSSCYMVRTFTRFLDYYGFVQIKTERIAGVYKEKIELAATDLFRAIFEIKKSNLSKKEKPINRLSIEKDFANLFEHIQDQNFENIEDLNAFLNQITGKKVDEILSKKKGKKSDKETATELVIEAYDSSPEQGRSLAQRAIQLDPQ